jgi:hypothetical protein
MNVCQAALAPELLEVADSVFLSWTEHVGTIVGTTPAIKIHKRSGIRITVSDVRKIPTGKPYQTRH